MDEGTLRTVAAAQAAAARPAARGVGASGVPGSAELRPVGAGAFQDVEDDDP